MKITNLKVYTSNSQQDIICRTKTAELTDVKFGLVEMSWTRREGLMERRDAITARSIRRAGWTNMTHP